MTHVTIIVRIERDKRIGARELVWQNSVTEVGSFPSHLAQQELFHVAHAQLHPMRPEPPHRHD